MFASFRFAARRAAAAARPRRIRTPTPLPAGFVNSQTAITDEALLDIATDRWFGKTFPPKVIGRVRDDEVGQRYLIIGEKKDEVGLRHTGQILWQKSYAGNAGYARRIKSHRSHSGGFLGYINEKFGKEEGLFLEMVKAAFGDRLHEDTLKDLVNNKFFQTDHLLASVCDDPENFFVMFRTLNNGFDFQTKSNFKKLYTGPAWHAAIHFVRKALIMHRRYYSAQ